MRVLFVSPKSAYSGKPFGGAEKSMTTMAEEFSKLGHTVAFLTRKDNYRYKRGLIKDIKGVSIYFLTTINLPALRFAFMQLLNYKIRKRILFNALDKYFFDFDIIYVYNENPSLINLVKWKRKSGSRAKIIYRVAGIYWDISFDRTLKRSKELLEYAFNGADVVNFNSLGTKELFLSRLKKYNMRAHFNKELILDIGTNIRGVRAFWDANLNKERELVSLIMPARFDSKDKLHELIITAFKSWGRPDSELVFAGDGPTKKKIQEVCANDSFLKGRVRFLGFVEQSELSDWLLKSSVFCLCSRSEGMSKAIAEAMSLGVPMICSNVLAINTYVDNGKTGFLVNNVEADWVKAFEDFSRLSIKELECISENERAYAKQYLDSEVNAKKYIMNFQQYLLT